MKVQLSYHSILLLKNWLKGFIDTWTRAKKAEAMACAAINFKLVKRLASKAEFMDKNECKISLKPEECAVIYKAWMESPFTMGQAPPDFRNLITQIDKTHFA